MSIQFVKFSPRDNPDYLAQLVECFRNVFAEAPWNELLKCSKCGLYWGIKHLPVLAENHYLHCGVDLVDYWPRVRVLHDIQHEVTKDASCWLAIADDKVVGFTWGYPIRVDDLSGKLKTALDVHSFGLNNSSIVIYQDEVGVVSEYRNKGIAKELVKLRNHDLCAKGNHVGIVRTRKDPEPSVTYMWYDRLGYTIVGDYPEGDGRVIMAHDLRHLFLS